MTEVDIILSPLGYKTVIVYIQIDNSKSLDDSRKNPK